MSSVTGNLAAKLFFWEIVAFLFFCQNSFAKKQPSDFPAKVDIEDVWNMDTAWRQRSPTREKICINGLWRFLPVVDGKNKDLPAEKEPWGWFKVPGIWPEDAESGPQYVLLAPDFNEIDQAWYRREIVVPEEWAGRRILIEFTMVQTHARVLIDGAEAGEVWFPGGQLDVTGKIKCGMKQTLAILFTARPLEEESTVFMAPERIFKSKAKLRLKGLTGDVFILSEPKQDAVGTENIITSTRKNTITIDTKIANPGKGKRQLSARVLRGKKVVKKFESGIFDPGTLKDGRMSFSAQWKDAKLWDTDTPQNIYELAVRLSDANGKMLDSSLPVSFGFREFWIDGRDFYLNGKRIHLRALDIRNISNKADQACLESCLNTCRKMKEYGFNFFITANYNFSPGSVGYIDGLFQAADQTGVLASFSLPHCKDFSWKLDTPQQNARYRKLTEWLIRRVKNHPSIILYAMNHNANGYFGDQNPLKIDGIYKPEEDIQRKQSMIAADIAGEFDPTRPVYHHQSGNLGRMHTINIYLNWAPKQERSDWLEHWAAAGVKPLFFVEWGMPHVSSWSSYRGPEFIWRCVAFQQLWDSEFNAAYIGQEAYRMTPEKVKSMEVEEGLWAEGKPFHWWELLRGLRIKEEIVKIQALFGDDNWRSHRTWGISAILPWDQEGIWTMTGEPESYEVADRYKDLQRPGIVPDIINPGSQYIYHRDAADFKPSSLGRSFLRWNMPLLVYIGGGPDRFTEKGNNFTRGETIHKQLVIVNDTRHERSCKYRWQLTPGNKKGRGKVTVQAGEKVFVPVSISLPESTKPGSCSLSAAFDFGKGEKQQDSFELNIMPEENKSSISSKVALFDPAGMTAKLLDGLGVGYETVDADSSLEGFDILVIGREALRNDKASPSLEKVPEGLKVLVFEQTAEVLMNRLGFRINVHGIRQAFIRASKHPVLDGLTEANFHDWRGAATLTPPYLDLEYAEQHDPKWYWCSFQNTRVWRCGNHGNVCSVLIEKPPQGNWMPIIDCAFDLQYTPLLEYVEGKGRVIFCQLDVTARTREDPAARKICANLLSYLDKVKPAPARKVLYAGNKPGADLLRRLGMQFEKFSGQVLDGKTLLVVGPGSNSVPKLNSTFKDGLNLLCLGLNSTEIEKLLPGEVKIKNAPTVPTLVQRFDIPQLSGISNAELHWRTLLSLAASGETSEFSNEALKVIPAGRGNAVLCQAAPWMFDYRKKPYLRTTYRRNVFIISRLLNNLGARSVCPLTKLWHSKPAVHYYPLPAGWKGKADRKEVGRNQEWWKPDFDDSDWKSIKVPGAFDAQFEELQGYDGVFWYRVRFTVPERLGRDNLTLHIGPVDDESWIWLNGKFIGEVTKKTNPEGYWSFPREYEMKPGMLDHRGENVLVVRVNDTYEEGGIFGDPRITVSGVGAWFNSYYLQKAEAEDDPYRYYRW